MSDSIINEKKEDYKEICKKRNINSSHSQTTVYTKMDRDREYEQKLKKPRSKRRMKMLRMLDLPSLSDEEIIKRMHEESEDDFMLGEISSENIMAYISRVKDEFEEMVERDIAEEKRQEELRIAEEKRLAEEKRREEERKEEERKRLEEQRERTLQYVLCRCYIEGCVVHTIGAKQGWESVVHYSVSDMPDDVKKAYDVYRTTRKCDAVEVYPKKMVALAASGEVIKIIK